MPGIQFGRFAPSIDVPEGRMLRESGLLMITISSRETGAHLTLRLRCSRRTSGPVKWPTVPFAAASHVFVDDFDGEEIATYDPARGVLAFSAHASHAQEWTVAALLRYMAGADSRLIEQAELASFGGTLDFEALAAGALRAME